MKPTAFYNCPMSRIFPVKTEGCLSIRPVMLKQPTFGIDFIANNESRWERTLKGCFGEIGMCFFGFFRRFRELAAENTVESIYFTSRPNISLFWSIGICFRTAYDSLIDGFWCSRIVKKCSGRCYRRLSQWISPSNVTWPYTSQFQSQIIHRWANFMQLIIVNPRILRLCSCECLYRVIVTDRKMMSASNPTQHFKIPFSEYFLQVM